MNIRKFFAKTSREALNMVKKELGDNAIILSNREVDGGSQILASREEDMDSFINESSTPAAEVTLSSTVQGTHKLPIDDQDSFVAMIRKQQMDAAPAIAHQKVDATSIPRRQPTPLGEPSSNQEMANFMVEIRGMRDVLQSQIAEISWSNAQRREPFKVSLLNRMLAAGLALLYHVK